MALEVKFSKSAVEDLNSIKEYICLNNFIAAQKVVAYIIKTIEDVLVENPSVGRAGRVLRTRELVLNKYPYIIPYQVRDGVIYILRVFHTSKKWEI